MATRKKQFKTDMTITKQERLTAQAEGMAAVRRQEQKDAQVRADALNPHDKSTHEIQKVTIYND